jgi:hypothetical protein
MRPLRMVGGGWTHVVAPQPLSMALAVVVAVPWGDANRRHPVSVVLRDEDGQDVTLPGGENVRNEGQFGSGDPPASRRGATSTRRWSSNSLACSWTQAATSGS